MRILKMASLISVFFLLMGATAFSAVDVTLQGPDSVATSSAFDIVVNMSGQDSVGAATVVVDFDNTLVEITGLTTADLSDVVVPGANKLADINANGTFTLAYATINGFVPGTSTNFATVSCQSTATASDAAFSFGGDTVLQSSAIPFPAVTGTLTGKTVSVTAGPVDTTPPDITVLGDDPATVVVGSNYQDAGATATDNIDGQVNVQADLTQVDTATAGVAFTVTYTATDAAGNTATATRTVNVVPEQDTTPPNITILGDNPATVVAGTNYQDAGATATDAVDGNINVQADLTQVDTTTAGTSFVVAYTATDSSGNTANATRTVNVVAVATCNAALSVTNYDMNTVTFDTTGSAGDLTIDFGENGGAVAVAGTVVDHTYAPTSYPANFTVSLTASTDENPSCSTASEQITLYQPVLSTPVDNADVDILTPELAIDPASAPGMTSDIVWQIGILDANLQPVFEPSATNLLFEKTTAASETAITVPELVLESDTTYPWRVQFTYADGLGNSVYSDAFQFNVTAAADVDDNGNGVPNDSEIPPTYNEDLDNDGAVDDNAGQAQKVITTAKAGVFLMASVADETKELIEAMTMIDVDAADLGVNDAPYGFFAAKFNEVDTTAAEKGVVKVRLHLSEALPADTMLWARDMLGELTEIAFDAISPDRQTVDVTIDASLFDQDGNQDNNSVLFNGGFVVPPPCSDANVRFSASDMDVMMGESVTFVVDAGSYGDTFTWFVDDEQFGTGNSASYSFFSIGEVTVTLVAREGADCPEKRETMVINVGEFHDDNCFIATSAAGGAGFFGLASLIAALAGAVAWRKRR